MSGSSLDGVDLAVCHFEQSGSVWSFRILESACVPLGEEWQTRLLALPQETAEEYVKAHVEFGHFLGVTAKTFLKESSGDWEVELIASHGHTIFHEPSKKYTAQIGDGAAIAAQTNINTLSDLRAIDIARGGQGAPIVPIGDQLLFPDYKYCLNLGGIANISEKGEERILAYDICGCNQLLNKIANRAGLPYDDEGKLARSGKVNQELLDSLNESAFYEQAPPKSLSNVWVQSVPVKKLTESNLSDKDILATACKHIAEQIEKVANSNNSSGIEKILITGGGAFNSFLIEQIAERSALEVVVPNRELVEYKEALVMAFIGALNLNNETNVLSSVTGAVQNSILGALHKASHSY